MIKKMLNGFGYSEIISYSLVSKKHIDNSVMPLSGAVELANPASDERRYFRTSIMPSLLDTVAFNTARSNDKSEEISDFLRMSSVWGSFFFSVYIFFDKLTIFIDISCGLCYTDKK